MKGKRSTMPHSTSGAGAAPARTATYTGPAPLREVMFEQLDYLLAHTGKACPTDCAECIRLEHVKFWLLEPFQGVI
jgi:hypothetical protein